MKTRTLLIILIALVLMGSALLSGCGGGSLSLSNLTSEQLYSLGKEKYEQKKYSQAVEAFQQLIYNFPGQSIVDTAQYFLALSYYGNEDYELAEVEFNRLLVNYPASAYATHAQFMRAVSAYETTPEHFGLDQSDLDKAIEYLEDFIIDHPESELVADANKYLLLAQTRLARKMYNAGVTYTRMGAAKAAKVYYQKVIDDYTGTEYAALANFALAEEEMHTRNYDEAARRVENFATVYPDHELAPKAKELAAEASFKAGKAALEKAEYQSAAEKLNEYVTKYPNDGHVKDAKEYLARIEHQLANGTPSTDGQPK